MPGSEIVDYSQKQVYGAIRGSDALRDSIARRHNEDTASSIKSSQVLVTNGAIQANFLALYTLVGPGDHVICQYPTYQQLYSIPESFGAEVDLWRSKPDDGWRLDYDELRSLIKPNTKLIIINNPTNPTGAVQSRQNLQEIVDIARKHDITVHSDEVYRPLFHSTEEMPPSIVSLGYEKCYATGSMSKAYSLAGIRLGWIASPSQSIIEACAASRHYTTISVGQVDDQIARYALGPAFEGLTKRNLILARETIALVDAFVQKHSWACQWTKPQAGTTAFIKFVGKEGRPIDDVDFCKVLLEKTGVMLVPGSLCFGDSRDFKGYVRIGYVQEQQAVVDGLKKLEDFMKTQYQALSSY
ncbi:putative aminotransferase [Aureobasidium sp. EXF-10727]|nr:putative aminotransferase [Aureobasidium sp. EXF-10727]KAI4723852.1 putative aminotransferase [Aureobasidium sp. EXF-10728]